MLAIVFETSTVRCSPRNVFPEYTVKTTVVWTDHSILGKLDFEENSERTTSQRRNVRASAPANP